jgi:hypothetical protein
MSPANDAPAARAAALAVLGLSDHASPAQILAAYRRLARTTHPDATGRTDPSAGERFAEIHDAFELLMRPHREDPEGLQPAGGSAEPARPASAPPPAHPAQPAQPRGPAPVRDRSARVRRPIVAGPVIVTGLPDSERTKGVGDDH